MRDRTLGFGIRRRLPVLFVVSVLLAGATLLTAAPAYSPPPESAPGPPPAITAYKDPETGRFEPPPAAVARRLAGVGAPELDRSTAGLVERPGETPAGGMRLSLSGRFHSRTVARRGADGRLVVTCRTEPSVGPEAGGQGPVTAPPAVGSAAAGEQASEPEG